MALEKIYIYIYCSCLLHCSFEWAIMLAWVGECQLIEISGHGLPAYRPLEKKILCHVPQTELRIVSMSHKVTNTWFPKRNVQIGLCCLHRKPQSNVKPVQLSKPVKSTAVGKTVSDHVIVM